MPFLLWKVPCKRLICPPSKQSHQVSCQILSSNRVSMSVLHSPVRYLQHTLVSYLFKVFWSYFGRKVVPGPSTAIIWNHNFSCSEGHRRAGSRVRLCEANGTWSGNTTTCESKDLKKTQNLTRPQSSMKGKRARERVFQSPFLPSHYPPLPPRASRVDHWGRVRHSIPFAIN